MSTTNKKYDVFLNFRGKDTRSNFISCLYKELVRCDIKTFKDDKELKSGESITTELNKAIEESRFAIVVVSKNYTESSWCLEELVKIMDLRKEKKIEVIPIFYGVNPADLRYRIGVVAEHFEKHKSRKDVDLEKVLSWEQALINLGDIRGYSNWQNDSKMIDKIAKEISKSLQNSKPRRSGSKLEGINTHMEAIRKKIDLMKSNKTVTVFGIWGTGGTCRSAFAKFVYDNISQHFDFHRFIDNVRRISQDHLRREVVEKIQEENWSLSRLKNKKVLLVLDDVNKLEQLDTLADYYNSFGSGSIVIIITQDMQLLKSANIKNFYEVELLRFQNVGELSRQSAFRERHESDGEIFLLSKRRICYEKLLETTSCAMMWLGCLRG